jgi:hypothetical protein
MAREQIPHRGQRARVVFHDIAAGGAVDVDIDQTGANCGTGKTQFLAPGGKLALAAGCDVNNDAIVHKHTRLLDPVLRGEEQFGSQSNHGGSVILVRDGEKQVREVSGQRWVPAYAACA